MARRCHRLFDSHPFLIRIVLVKGLSQLSGVRAEVLLIDDSILTDNEGHHSGSRVFRRIGQKGKPPSHLAVDDVVLRSTYGLLSLLGQDLEIVAIKRRGS